MSNFYTATIVGASSSAPVILQWEITGMVLFIKAMLLKRVAPSGALATKIITSAPLASIIANTRLISSSPTPRKVQSFQQKPVKTLLWNP